MKAGVTYVVYGAASMAPMTLGTGGTTKGYTVYGANVNDLVGSAVSGAGDVNGDGFGDILLGAPSMVRNSGTTYVLYGAATNAVTPLTGIHLDSLASALGFVVTNIANPYYYTGVSVSGVGECPHIAKYCSVRKSPSV